MKRKGKDVLIVEPKKMKSVSKDETIEFIDTFKRRKYLVVEQLKKLSAQISILSLLLSSKAHRDAMLKILMSLMSWKVSRKNLKHIVGQIAGTNTIIFNKDRAHAKRHMTC